MTFKLTFKHFRTKRSNVYFVHLTSVTACIDHCKAKYGIDDNWFLVEAIDLDERVSPNV